MTITLEDLALLDRSAGQMLLAQLADADLSEKNSLSLVTRLRKEHPPELVSAALTMARLRQKATAKFGDVAQELYFTEDALQQASDPLVRRYRAQNLAGERVLDVCCGIGSDSLTFAQHGAEVMGLDFDPVRIAIAQHNADILGQDIQFRVQDVRESVFSGYDRIFYDPARRDEQGNRIYDVEQYIPPLSLVKRWQAEQITVKLSPGVDLAQVESYGGGVEFISAGGDLKEAVLHIGAGFKDTRAVLLDGEVIFHWQRDSEEPDVPFAAPHGWLCEPDASILRADLVRDVVAAFEGTMLDETIAYFCTDHFYYSPWLRSWEILDWMPFNLKKLRAYLREHSVGRVTVKKRGFAMTPEEIIPRLKLKGNESRLLIFTRHQGQPVVLICVG
ncbi:MAG: methyltransferase domain-containing protein [Anaerolineae bacterium]|nr:methyltransferase domain-containing protein [Anaerolineae bacterium]